MARMTLVPVLAGPALLVALGYGITVVAPATADVNSTRTAATREYTKGAVKGRALYAQNGCVSCHTLQRLDTFTDAGTGSDVSGPADDLNDAPAMLGQVRYGPDLSCVGDRVAGDPSHYVDTMVEYLKDPSARHPGSTMPSYRFLLNADLRRLAAFLVEHRCEQ